MTTAGPLFPSAAVNDASIGTLDWTNPTFAEVDDGTNYATFSTSSVGALSHYLKLTGFGLSLPVNTVVDGITFEIHAYCDNTPVGAISNVRLVVGSSIVGTTKSVGALTNSPAWYTLGGVTDLWSTTPTVAQLNDTGFGVVMGATSGRQFSGVLVDAGRLTIDYHLVASWADVVSGVVVIGGAQSDVVTFTATNASGLVTFAGTVLENARPFPAATLYPTTNLYPAIPTDYPAGALVVGGTMTDTWIHATTVAGTLNLGGIEAEQKTYRNTPTGALVAAGSRTETHTDVVRHTSILHINGGLAETYSHNNITEDNPSGVLAVTGEVSEVHLYTFVVTGELDFTSVISEDKIFVDEVSADLTSNGMVDATTGGAEEPVGLMRLGGSSNPVILGVWNLGGTVARSETFADTPTGELAIGGHMPEAVKYRQSMSGRVQCAGACDVASTYRQTVRGGFRWRGTISQTKTISDTVTNNLVVHGGRTQRIFFRTNPSGVLNLDGGVTSHHHVVHTPHGHLRVDGSPDIAETYAVTVEGLLNFGGVSHFISPRSDEVTGVVVWAGGMREVQRYRDGRSGALLVTGAIASEVYSAPPSTGFIWFPVDPDDAYVPDDIDAPIILKTGGRLIYYLPDEPASLTHRPLGFEFRPTRDPTRVR